jgi:hypothetical protein
MGGKLSVAAFYENGSKYDIIEVVFVSSRGQFKIKAEVADTREKKLLGLMHRSYLAPEAGMLFVFQTEALRSFWMKNTLIPLDMIFVSKDLRIVHIVENAVPCKESPCDNYSSLYPAKYVVEINAGLSRKMGLEPGNHIELNLP